MGESQASIIMAQPVLQALFVIAARDGDDTEPPGIDQFADWVEEACLTDVPPDCNSWYRFHLPALIPLVMEAVSHETSPELVMLDAYACAEDGRVDE